MGDNLFLKIVDNRKLALIVILFFTALVYINTFVNEFVMDDISFIQDWPLIQDANNFPQFFGPDNQPPTEKGVYSPLKTLVHFLNYQLFRQNPFGYHLIALLIHALGVSVVYFLSLLLSRNKLAAFLAGILFAVHPVNTEAITFLTASVDSLGVVLLFVSYLFYINSREEIINYLLAILFAAAAVFTHELVIILPALFLLHEICFGGKKVWKLVLARVSPFFVISVVYIVLKRIILGTVTRGDYLFGSFYLTMLVIIKAFAKYIITLFFPFKLAVNQEISPGIYSVDWQYFDKYKVLGQSIIDWQTAVSLVLILLIIIIAVKNFKADRIKFFCIMWFFISLIPVSNIVPSECYFALRYLYLAGFGAFLLVAIYITRYFEDDKVKYSNKKRLVYVLVAILGFLIIRSVLRNSDWSNELAFAENEAREFPGSAQANKNLGAILLSYGRIDDALNYLKRSIAIAPYADTYFVLAQAYAEGRNKEMERVYLHKAIELDSTFAEAYYNLGVLYFKEGDNLKAKEYLAIASSLLENQNNKQFLEATKGLLNKVLSDGK